MFVRARLFVTGIFLTVYYPISIRLRAFIFGIPHNFINWLALLLQVNSLERPLFT
jgi:hypothetical protein